MSVAVKRKRGRPRLDEPREIKDFDNNLIQEFKKYPVFYDRQHPQHRNREYTDRIWQRIAQNLNVSVNLVKTRMLQLRNRFNLEKRRVEAMKEQHHSSATSQWSLYERLSFLSSYVKTRRPYSLATSQNAKASSTASSSNGEEEDVDDEINGTKSQENTFNSNQITEQNGDDFSATQNHFSTEGAAPQQVYRTVLQPTKADKDFGDKYKAFGEFLASSLIEMNEMQALNLVEKFTMDLVKYLKTEDTKRFINLSRGSNTDGEDENNSALY